MLQTICKDVIDQIVIKLMMFFLFFGRKSSQSYGVAVLRDQWLHSVTCQLTQVSMPHFFQSGRLVLDWSTPEG